MLFLILQVQNFRKVACGQLYFQKEIIKIKWSNSWREWNYLGLIGVKIGVKLLKSFFWYIKVMSLRALQRKFKVFKELIISSVSEFSLWAVETIRKDENDRKLPIWLNSKLLYCSLFFVTVNYVFLLEIASLGWPYIYYFLAFAALPAFITSFMLSPKA